MGNIAEVMESNEGYLTELDSQIGDADHGANMRRGFQEVKGNLQEMTNAEISTLLSKTGMTLMEKVGGAAGPLYGMFFLKAAKPAIGKKDVDKKDLALMLEAGLDGLRNIGGGTVVGDKTMVDAIEPAVAALKDNANNESMTLNEALQSSVKAAKVGMNKTVLLLARKGRASYLGERSIGHQDPGATSAYLILRTILETLNGRIGIKVEQYSADGSICKEIFIT